MANKYWVGGGSSHAWNATSNTNWSDSDGGSNNATAPGAGDDVFFNGNGTNAQDNVLISSAVSVHSINFTGYTGTLTVSGTRTLTLGGGATLTTAAVLTLGSGMTWTGGGTFTITVDNRSGGFTLTTNGVTMSGTSILQSGSNASTVGFTLADSCTVSGGMILQRGTITVTSGTTLTLGTAIQFTGAAGTSTFVYSGATVILGTDLLFASGTGGTLAVTSDSGSVIKMTGAGRTFAGNGLTYNGTVWFGASTGTTTITGSNTFGAWSSAGASTIGTTTISVTSGTTQTLTTAGFVNGRGLTHGFSLKAATGGSAFTLTCNAGYLVSGNLTLQDCTGSGATPFFAGSDSTLVSGNTNWVQADPYPDIPLSQKGPQSFAAVQRASNW